MERFSFEPKTCWIADVKKRMGYDVKPAPNRQGEERACPCPEDKLKKLTEAIMKA
jgi:hypothetical protein